MEEERETGGEGDLVHLPVRPKIDDLPTPCKDSAFSSENNDDDAE